MATILSNGTRIWRYNNLILRSPIYKQLTLTPSGCAYYDVGSDFKQSLPTRDFFVTNRGVYAIASGHDCRQAYLGYKYPTPSNYIWRNNTAWGSLPDTGTMWYNGNWSPAFGASGGAAFIRMAAYKFTIPSKYAGYTVSNVEIETGDIGTVMVCGSPKASMTRPQDRFPVFAWDAATNILPSNSGLRNKNVSIKFGAWTEQQLTSGFPPTQYTNSQVESTINMQNTDACNATTQGGGVSPNIPLWVTWPDKSVVYNDGVIPDAPTNPHVQLHGTNPAFQQVCSQNSTFFISLMFGVGDSRSGDSTVTAADGPYYYQSTSSTAYYKTWWCCQRFWIRKINVTISIGEE